MESTSLTQLADEQLAAARSSNSGRAAHTVHGGHDHQLRQTLIALASGHELSEHHSPGGDHAPGAARPRAAGHRRRLLGGSCR